MTTDALIDTLVTVPHSADTLGDEILKQINEQDVVSLDALISLMPQYSWNQIFHTVDRLARRGKIVLRRYRFEYTIFSNHYTA
jgi:hypothetical protein